MVVGLIYFTLRDGVVSPALFRLNRAKVLWPVFSGILRLLLPYPLHNIYHRQACSMAMS